MSDEIAAHVLSRLDALVEYHKAEADAATARDADSAEARVERARWAGVRDARACVALALGVSG